MPNPFDQFDEPENKEETNPFDKFDEGTNPFDQFDENKAMTVARIAGRGIPVLGQFISETPETDKFTEDNPLLSGAIGLGAGTLATLPFTGPLAAGAAAVKGMGLIPSLFKSALALSKTGMMGAGIGALDEMARQLNKEKELNIKDIGKSGALSGALSALMPVGGKVLSPGLRTATSTRMGKAALLSGLGGLAAGFNPLLSALVGGGVRAYGTNRALNKPLTQAILSALGATAGSNIDDALPPPTP